MATCKECGDEVESLVKVRVAGKFQRLCEDCAEVAREQAEIAEEGEAAMKDMMGFKGGW